MVMASLRLENEGACVGPDTTRTGASVEVGAGPGGAGDEHEFFYDERWDLYNGSTYVMPRNSDGTGGASNPSPDYHHETGRGALAVLPGSYEAVFTVYDTIDTFENGVAVFNTADGGGDSVRRVQFYDSEDFFGKGGGGGDIELLCDAAPIEIGNLVWDDVNGNGIQDADETGVSGLTVQLYFDVDGDGDIDDDDDGVGVSNGLIAGATATTDSSGNYLFSSATGTSTTGSIYNLSQITYGRLYQVRLDLSGLAGTNDAITRIDYLGNAGDSDIRDSDGDTGALADGFSSIEIITGSAGVNRHDLDFGVTELAGLGSFVWFDDGSGGGTAADGIQQVSEPGVDGVTVTLYNVGPDGIARTGDDIMVDSEVTSDGSTDIDGDGSNDAIGEYFFEDISPGTYYVGFTDLPSGYSFSEQNNGSGTNATDSDAEIISGLSGTVSLAPGDTNNDIDAGINNVTASLGDYIWHDLNKDGYQDLNEPGIAGVSVALYQDVSGSGSVGVFDVSDFLIAITTTDSAGRYLFSGLSTNDGVGENAYFVVVTDADLNTGDLSSSNGGDGQNGTNLEDFLDTPNHIEGGNENNTNGSGATFLSAGEVNLLSDFGYDYDDSIVTPTIYSITDTVWFDPDEDGDGDGGGPGYEAGAGDIAAEGVTVQLLRDPDGIVGNGDEVVIAETTTDSNGDVVFNGLPNGNYIISIEDESDVLNEYFGTDSHSIASYRSVTISGSNVVNESFSYDTESGVIGDTIWLDNGDGAGTAQNGIQDGTEAGIGGVTVRLFRDINQDGDYDAGTDFIIATQTTDSNGEYLFSGLVLGYEYTVEVTDTDGILTGLTNYGDPDSVLDGFSRTVISDSSPMDLDQDFGYDNNSSPVLVGSISGIVFRDRDLAGEVDYDTILADLDDDQDNMNGVTVTLYQSVGNGTDGTAGTSDDDWVAIRTVDTIETTVTDNLALNTIDGYYTFTALQVGQYYYVDVEENTVNNLYPTNTSANDPVAGAAPVGSQIINLSGGGDGEVVDGTDENTVEDDQDTLHTKVNFGFSGSFVNPAWLSTFYAQPTDTLGSVIFHWTTSLEFRNLGFILYAYDGTDWVKVTPELIRSQVIDSDGESTEYELRLNGVPGLYYSIIDVDLDFNLGLHGPFRLGIRYGSEDAQKDQESTTLEPDSKSEVELRQLLEERLRNHDTLNIKQDFIQQTRETIVVKHDVEKTGWFIKALSLVTALITTPAYAEDLAYLHIDEPGVYRVYADDLGISKRKARRMLSKMTVHYQGDSVPVLIGSSSGRVYLEFIGDSFNSLYTDKNTYILGIERRRNRNRVRTDRSRPPSRQSSAISHYMHTVKVDPQSRYLQSSPSTDRDPYYYNFLFGFGSPVSRTLDVNVTNLAENVQDSITVNAEVWSIHDVAGRTDDHHAVLAVDGIDLDSQFFDGVQTITLQGTLPTGVLSEGINNVDIIAPSDHGVPYELMYVDSASITYPRNLEVTDGQLKFNGIGNIFEISNFKSKKIRIYRRNDRGVRIIRGITRYQNDIGWVARIRGSSRPSDYFILEGGSEKSPDIQLLDNFENSLLVGDAEYLVIAANSFVESDALKRLVDRRFAEGYTTKLVNLDNIIQQYSHGRYDVDGIQEYLRYAYNNLNLKMVLLVGDDTRDYLGNENSGQVSHLPTPYGRVHSEIRLLH